MTKNKDHLEEYTNLLRERVAWYEERLNSGPIITDAGVNITNVVEGKRIAYVDALYEFERALSRIRRDAY